MKIAVRRRLTAPAARLWSPAGRWWPRRRRRCAPALRPPRARRRPHVYRVDRGDHRHADPAIEGPQHFRLCHRSFGGEPAEDRRHRYGSEIEPDSEPSGSTRGRLSGKPPPVICASALIGAPAAAPEESVGHKSASGSARLRRAKSARRRAQGLEVRARPPPGSAAPGKTRSNAGRRN